MFTRQNHTNQTSNARQVKRAFSYVVLSFLLMLGASPVLLAQTPLANKLGLKQSDLEIKRTGGTYQENPMVNESSNSDLVGLQGAKTQSTSGVSDMVGTFSIQNFQGTQATLYNTHASADGFRNYFTTWYTPNFAYRDGGVGNWAYRDIAGGDNYDLWSYYGTDYGIDAVRACWHSGHGGMASTNVFFAPMGYNWGGRGWNAFSNQMMLGGNNYSYGDERLRYMFWDTCNSVVVNGGSDPYSTWGTRSRGIRMVFGYTTTSIDSSNYGKFFWEEWNKGKSLTTAFLDASWRISTGQSPSVVAFGANSTEAIDRLNNERYLYSGAVSANWGQWRWYYARSAAASAFSADRFSQAAQAGVRQIVPASNSDAEISSLAQTIGLQMDPSAIQNRPFGLRAVLAQGMSLIVEKNGNFELSIEQSNLQDGDGKTADEDLVAKAQGIASALNLTDGQDSQVGMIRDLNENGGFEGFQSTAHVVSKTVVIDQLINGVPFIDPEAGHLEITFDAQTGQVTRVRSTLVKLAPETSLTDVAAAHTSVADARAAALQSLTTAGTPAQTMQVVSNTENVGFYLIDGKAVPVYRAQFKDTQFEFGRPLQALTPLVK